jgi:hypothetical protein
METEQSLEHRILPVCRLSGVKVVVLAIGRKVRWFKPGSVSTFLSTIKIRSTPSF